MKRMSQKILGSICIGEHVPDLVAQALCRWLTACARETLPPDELRTVWETWCEDGEADAPVGAEAHGVPWMDFLEAIDGEDIPSFYAQVFPKAQTFVAYDQDAFMSLIALAGPASDRQIIGAVLARAYDPGMDNGLVLR